MLCATWDSLTISYILHNKNDNKKCILYETVNESQVAHTTFSVDNREMTSWYHCALVRMRLSNWENWKRENPLNNAYKFDNLVQWKPLKLFDKRVLPSTQWYQLIISLQLLHNIWFIISLIKLIVVNLPTLHIRPTRPIRLVLLVLFVISKMVPTIVLKFYSQLFTIFKVSDSVFGFIISEYLWSWKFFKFYESI